MSSEDKDAMFVDAVKAMQEYAPENQTISFGVTSYYNQYRGFEVVDVCEQLRSPDGSGNFNRGNAFKYLARAGWKNLDTEIQDLEKAQNYIQREITRLKDAKLHDENLAELQKALVSDEPYDTWDAVIWIEKCVHCRADTILEIVSDGTRVRYCPLGHGRQVVDKSFGGFGSRWVRTSQRHDPEPWIPAPKQEKTSETNYPYKRKSTLTDYTH